MASQEIGKAENFGYLIRTQDGVTFVDLRGELDLATAAELRECLTIPEVFDSPRVRIDLEQVAFLGSTGIGLLVSACKRSRTTGGAFSVRGANDMVRRVLEVAGLVEYFELASDDCRQDTTPLAAVWPRGFRHLMLSAEGDPRTRR
jgi:anti-sigma B factor antagonist